MSEARVGVVVVRSTPPARDSAIAARRRDVRDGLLPAADGLRPVLRMIRERSKRPTSSRTGPMLLVRGAFAKVVCVPTAPNFSRRGRLPGCREPGNGLLSIAGYSRCVRRPGSGYGKKRNCWRC